MKKALVYGSRVAQVVEMGEEFPVHQSLHWVECPDDVRDSWTYVDGEFMAPPPREY